MPRNHNRSRRRMQQLARQIWQQMYQVGKSYWFSSEKWEARRLLGLVFLLSLSSSTFLVLESLQRGEIISALVAGNTERFGRAMLVFCALILIGVPLIAFNQYLQNKLSLYWRRWLTHYFLNRYFSQHKFYHLSFNDTIDNPDQRISEDINIFTQQSLFLLTTLLDSILQIIGFTALLWSISKALMFFLVIYAIVGTGLTIIVFGKTLTQINIEQLKREANFRFGLVRIRENAEAIAFYQGQSSERDQVQGRFLQAFNNFNRLLHWQFNLNLFQNSYQYLTFILPFIVLAPRLFSGELEIGAVTQSQAAFERIGFSLSLVINQFDKVSVFAASVSRLAMLGQVLDTSEVVDATTTIDVQESPNLTLKNLTLFSPNYQTNLVKDLSVNIPLGQSLLIIGESGVGKSSLLRSIAGLWYGGTGAIARPKREQILFLPQRPYLPLGSLRCQLFYPYPVQEMTDQQLGQILQTVNLTDLVNRFGSLDQVENWSQILSVGEQQRLAFARLLLTRPKYAILDEATSALDEENEALLYQHLLGMGATFVSVGHRSTLFKYHQQILKLTGNGEWEIGV